MPKRMLIDSSHPEETRVVVLDGQKVEEFDFEAASKRPLKGNIYLAKVTRVEPSLQAAFVEYGGNRQGFLAFSEIHPDYYQIPVADRQALLAEQEAEARRRSDEEFESVETATVSAPRSAAAELAESDDEDREEAEEHDGDYADDEEAAHDEEFEAAPEDEEHATADLSDDDADAESLSTENVAAAEANGEAPAQPLTAKRPSQRWMRKRHYKIQEVIKRRQVMLVQVVKEERGNKGAALTTYLSLAGRYCVLMPNTPRGGGISRKITSATDRKRLKGAAASLELPEGMGLIIRTAGANRTKMEIKRDYEYMLRMWDSIRELTLKSNAPACVYEEGDLVKRAIRDLYNKDVAEIVVEGEDGYRNAKDFMRMLMPSHAKNVKQYKEAVPLFHKHHIEAQLDAMFQPTVTLKSGGYIVINQTEALVSIDVNSGRATREHNIEDTAHKTNLEAADEVARQLRLRDLAGLIVIDFIDMEDARNDRAVEKRLHNAVRNDRARVQLGKISQFGLLEMSRQRLRAGVIAGSTVPCPHCAGQGIVRSVESTALRVLRVLEEEGQKQKAAAVSVRVPADVAVYTLNQKRRELMRIESDYGMSIVFDPSDTVTAGNFEIERTEQRGAQERVKTAVTAETALVQSEEAEVASPAEGKPVEAEAEAERGGGPRRRRRRRRGRGSERPAVLQEAIPTEGETEFDAEKAAEASETEATTGATAEGEAKRPRRRRRRGRRGRRGNGEQASPEAASEAAPDESEAEPSADHAEDTGELIMAETETNVVNGASEPVWSLAATPEEASAAVEPEAPQAQEPQAKISEAVAQREAAPEAEVAAHQSEGEGVALSEPDDDGAPRRGWWQRPFKARD